MDAVLVLLVLFVLATSGMAALVVARWVLRPLDRTARSAHGAPQLSVIDLFWIFFAIQLSMASAIGIPGAAFIAAMKLWDRTLFTFLEVWQLAATEAGLLAGAYFSGRLTRRMVAALEPTVEMGEPPMAGEMDAAGV